MKAWQYCVLLGLTVLLLGAGTLLLQQRAELETWKGRALQAETNASQQAAAQKAWEKTVREDQRLLAARQSAGPSGPSSTAGAKTSPARRDSFGEATKELIEDSLKADAKQWLADASDPAVLRRLNIQARNQTMKHYAAMFTQFNLPSEPTEALMKLLTDKRQAGLDFVVSSIQQGAEDPTKDMDALRGQIIESRTGIENQIHALLGDANYAQYQSYDRNFGQANVMKSLATTLLATPEPLTADQTERMTQLLQANNATRITTPVLDGAREILSPVQMQALQDMRAIQLANSQKRLQPGQVLPTAPAAPARKP